MILGQLRIWARQAKNAPLYISHFYCNEIVDFVDTNSSFEFANLKNTLAWKRTPLSVVLVATSQVCLFNYWWSSAIKFNMTLGQPILSNWHPLKPFKLQLMLGATYESYPSNIFHGQPYYEHKVCTPCLHLEDHAGPRSTPSFSCRLIGTISWPTTNTRPPPCLSIFVFVYVYV